jgi:hypothetical protein
VAAAELFERPSRALQSRGQGSLGGRKKADQPGDVRMNPGRQPAASKGGNDRLHPFWRSTEGGSYKRREPVSSARQGTVSPGSGAA